MKKRLLPILFLALVSCTSGGNEISENHISSSDETITSSEDNSFAWNEETSNGGVIGFSELVGSENSEFNWGEESNNSLEKTSSEITNEKEELNYNRKLEYFIEDYYIKDQEFVNYIINDEEYKDDVELANNAIFVSPNGSGEGKSKDDPCSIYDAFDSMKKGQTVYLRGGTYNLEESIYIAASGDVNNYITIRNYPLETPIITSTKENIKKYNENGEYVLFALDENVSYLKIEGLEFASISSEMVAGIVCWGGGQNHIIIRNNKFHDLKTSITDENNYDASANSILLLGEKSEPINNFLIYGNYCYDNVTGWAETISVAGNCEAIYVIENKLNNITNIGIDFYGNAEYCSIPELDQPRYCIAALNEVSESFCSYADCAGIYVDGARDILLTHNVSYNNQYGIEIGSEERNDSYPVKNIIVRNNLLYNNSVTGLRIGGYEENNTGYVKSTKIYNNSIINSESNNAEGITIAKVDGIEFINNIVTTKNNYVVSSDFSSSYTKNLIFKNNYFAEKEVEDSKIEFKLFNKEQVGIDEFNSLVNGKNLVGNIELSKTYQVLNGVTINAGDSSIEVGIYDLEFKNRKNDNIDIGCFEY